MSGNKKIINYINSWENKKIISQEQKNLMIKDIKNESSTSNFFKIIALIGALFIGLGIILVISSNWEYLPKLIKLILILSMPILGIGGGYFLSYVKEEYNKIGDAFIFLGTLLIGASLALLGQLYNLDGSATRLLLIWCILSIFPLFLFKFRILAYLSASLFYTTLFCFFVEDIWFSDGRVISLIFTAIPAVVITLSYVFRKFISSSDSQIFKVFEIVSIKVLFLTLFISTLENDLYLLGNSWISEFFQNMLFLGIVFFIMWFSNKNYHNILRNSTFFWLGAYMITKYFSWLWEYMQVGIFFLLFGIFLILLVFGYIKGTKYLEKIKNEK